MNARSVRAGAGDWLQARLAGEQSTSHRRPRTMLLGLLAALTMLAAACGGGGAQAKDLLEAVQSRGVLRAVSDPNYAPQSFYDARLGRWRGFDVDVASEIAARLDVAVRFQTGAFDDVAAGNWQDDWDISVGSVTVTPARAEKAELHARLLLRGGGRREPGQHLHPAARGRPERQAHRRL